MWHYNFKLSCHIMFTHAFIIILLWWSGNLKNTFFVQLEVFESCSGPSSKSLKGEIAHLFILDRSLDYATCLLSPLTYESLLDEVLMIYNRGAQLKPHGKLNFFWPYPRATMVCFHQFKFAFIKKTSQKHKILGLAQWAKLKAFKGHIRPAGRILCSLIYNIVHIL